MSRKNIPGSLIKIYFSACANGEVEKLKELLVREPRLLSMENGHSRRNGIFYAIKNLQRSTTDFLLEKGLDVYTTTLSPYIWNASPESYAFLKSYGVKLYNGTAFKNPSAYNEELFNNYKNYCYSNNKLEKLYSILRIENIPLSKEILEKILVEYKNYKQHNQTPAYLMNIRDLQIGILCD